MNISLGPSRHPEQQNDLSFAKDTASAKTPRIALWALRQTPSHGPGSAADGPRSSADGPWSSTDGRVPKKSLVADGAGSSTDGPGSAADGPRSSADGPWSSTDGRVPKKKSLVADGPKVVCGWRRGCLTDSRAVLAIQLVRRGKWTGSGVDGS